MVRLPYIIDRILAWQWIDSCLARVLAKAVGLSSYTELLDKLLQFGARPSTDEASVTKTVLFVTFGNVDNFSTDLMLVEAFRQAGFQPVIAGLDKQHKLERQWRLAGVTKFIYAPEVTSRVQSLSHEQFATFARYQDLLGLMDGGIRVGKCAVSTEMRKRRDGKLDFTSPGTKDNLLWRINESFAAADRARTVLSIANPDAVVMYDRGYTPNGELFDLCIERKLAVFSIDAAHKNNSLMLKR